MYASQYFHYFSQRPTASVNTCLLLFEKEFIVIGGNLIPETEFVPIKSWLILGKYLEGLQKSVALK